MISEDAIRAELMGLLRYANATAVGQALGVSAQAVLNWAEGKHTSQTRLDQVRSLYGLPVASQDTTTEAPRPAWAEGLPNEVAMEVVRLLIESPLVGQLADELRQAGWPLGAAPSEGSPEPPGDAGTTPRPSMKRAVRR